MKINLHIKPTWSSTKSEMQKLKQQNNFYQNFVNFITNIAIHCYHWLVEPKRTKYERFLWIIVHVTGAVSIISILNWTLEHHMTNPFVTTLYDTAYPISQIGFPGISICPNNVISKSRAKAYAKHLANMDSEGRDEAFFLKGIRHLGKLYDFEQSESFDLLGFQRILDQLEEHFDVASKLETLSPQCDELIVRCVWKGKIVNCTDELKMFHMSATASENAISISNYGPVSGLILYLNISADDYFYPLLPYIGVQLQVYNPNEVPDQFASEALISSGSETLVKIGANVITSDDAIRRYSMEKRRCMFSSDIAQIQSDPYFRSNCIRSCRLDSIIALCGCIPFFYLDLKPLLTNSTNVCTLDKLHCLNHFHVKWQTLLFSREKSVGVETEFENGLSCLQCLPSCSQTQYSISTTRLPLRTLPIQTRNMTRFGRDAVANSELIMLRLFYARPDHFLYRQYVAKNWFELLSELGGLSGVIIGFSLISVIEVLYFMVKQFYSAIQNHNHRRYSEKVKQGRNFIFFS